MDWEEKYLINDTPWDRGEPAPPLVDFASKRVLTGKVLVPGCGVGHDARFLAEQGCDVHAVDISPTALAKARAAPKPAKGALRFDRRDFLDPKSGLPKAAYDLLFEHTCFCAIDPEQRSDYAEAAARAVKPNGELLGIFFTDLDDEEGPPFGTSQREIETLFSPAFEIVEHWRPSSVFSGRENEERMYRMRRR